jgi:hypothetical protein
VLLLDNIRRSRPIGVRFQRRFHAKNGVCARGTDIDLHLREETPMSFLRNPLFWDKKIRIAILTLATFMALC